MKKKKTKFLISLIEDLKDHQTDKARLGNPAVEIFNKLAEDVRNLADAAFEQFGNAVANIMKTVKDTIEGFKEAANSAVGAIVDQLKHIANDAISKDINITECAVEEVIDELKDLPDLVLHHVQECTDVKIAEAQKILKEGKNSVGKIVQEVQDLASEANRCGLIIPICWVKESAEVAEAAVRLPVEIARSVARTLGLIVDLEEAVLRCKLDNIKELGKEAWGTFKNVTECIQNKSKHNVSSE